VGEKLALRFRGDWEREELWGKKKQCVEKDRNRAGKKVRRFCGHGRKEREKRPWKEKS